MSSALRKAAQQALEVLEEATSYTSCTTWSPSMTEECEAAAAALRAALAEPVQKPVAWMYDCGNGGRMYAEELDDTTGWIALYTAPPQRKPLTEEEIDKMQWAPSYENQMTLRDGLHLFARAIERAHGII